MVKKNKEWMKWYHRWITGWVDILQGIAKVVTFGALKIGWSFKIVNMFYSRNK
jgi:hypothetical protein